MHSQSFRLPTLAGAVVGGALATAVIQAVPGLLRLEPAAKQGEEAAIAPSLTWTDLASADTGAFAENLRRIGCPEETIRRIVTKGSPAAAPLVPPARKAAALAPLPAAASPATRPPAAPVVATPAPARSGDLVIVAPEGRVPLPVAFQPLPGDAAMAADRLAMLNMIQERFIADIGGPHQDPSSPAYKDAWRKAQARCDEAFKAAFGEKAYIRRLTASIRAASADVSQP